ncbi:hypothetical protein [Paenibacillus kobensis]|uniref:hypothetical protein n=1 Tax=Paenibacillus kobensis TaxID=59841 RepID=UPI001FE55175|nr:hypothetical protein [Paenibacillus kobensis]
MVPALSSNPANVAVTGITLNFVAAQIEQGKTAAIPLRARLAPQQTTVTIGDEVRGLKKTSNNLQFYVNGAAFADLHYKINNGAQVNVGMPIALRNGNFTYSLNNLQQGDKVEYFFTYNPGQGALDTQWFTYIHGVMLGS